MGNSASATKPLTKLQQDIKYLGERMPFGDGELQRLCRCIAAVEAQPSKDRVSFLSDFAVAALGGDATSEQRDERALLIQVLEAKVLPIGFGNILYKTAFLKAGEKSIYDDTERFSGGSDASPAKEEEEEENDTRLARLEQYFEGLSNCGRRGTKHVVKVLVNCCDTVSDDVDNPSESPLVRAKELIQLAYRIALSAAFLAASSKPKQEGAGDEVDEEAEQDNDMTRFLPAEDRTSQQELDSFARSIVAHATSHRERSGIPPLSAKAKEELLVACDDVIAWVDGEAPLFAATLSTFIFRIFCPGERYPPSRTEFVYPVILSESAFFEGGSSTLLFVFGCLSPSLNGTVRLIVIVTGFLFVWC